MSKLERDIKAIFHELYDYKLFGQHTTNKSLQKELERFRNQMAIDFYNLELRDSGRIKEFVNKYMFVDPTFEERYNSDPDHNKKYSELQRRTLEEMLKHEQRGFRKLTDKAIAGDHTAITDEETERINYHVFNTFNRMVDDNFGHYKISQTYAYPCDIHKGLYEWVMLVLYRQIEVGRCEADGCNKIFLPEKRGKKQIYCSATCKKRAFRHRHREDLATIRT